MRLIALALLLAVLIPACSSSDSNDPPAGDAAADLIPRADQSVPDPDQGVPEPDKGAPEPDKGAPEPDQGAPEPDQGTPAQGPELTSKHEGWQKKQCGDCHDLPEKGHTETNVAKCAECHGGNGACDPNAAKPHSGLTNCTGCHGGKRHGFTKNADCASCHLAAKGVVDCK